MQVPVGDRPVPAPARLSVREEQVARPAGADKRRLLKIRDVAVLGGDLRRAQLALFLCRGTPGRRPGVATSVIGVYGGRPKRAATAATKPASLRGATAR